MLRLLIPPTWPIQGTACGWALHDEHGRLAQSGFSDPRTWPADDACEVILTAQQCTCQYADIPAKAAKLDDEVIVLALEDQLPGDIADEHWTIGRAGRDGRIPVWLVRRQRVADVLEMLRQLGRKVQRLVWEPNLVSRRDDRWSVVLLADRGFVRVDDDRAWAFDNAEGDPPVELVLALDAARRAGQLPAALDLIAGGPVAADCGRWAERLGIPCVAAEAWDWRTGPISGARNLLTGPFAVTTDGQILRRLRPALWVAGIALAIFCLALVGDWFWLGQKETRMREEITAIYKRSFPGERPILDPFAQLQADAGRLANRHGELAAADFLALLAAVGGEAGTEVGQPSRIKYENRQLRLEWATVPKDVSSLIRALQAHGHAVQFVADSGRPATLVVGVGP